MENSNYDLNWGKILKIVAKIIGGIVLVPLVLLLVLLMRLCYLDTIYNAAPSSYFLPNDYRGYVMIIYNEPKGYACGSDSDYGAPCNYQDGDLLHHIPSKGFIIIQEEKPCRSGNYHPTYPQYCDRKRWSHYKGDIYIHDERYSKGEINDLSFKYQSFFVGTKAAYDSLAHVSPIDALNRDTIYHYLRKVRNSQNTDKHNIK